MQQPAMTADEFRQRIELLRRFGNQMDQRADSA